MSPSPLRHDHRGRNQHRARRRRTGPAGSRSWSPRRSGACTGATKDPVGHYPGAALRAPGRSRHSHGPWPQLRPPGHRGRFRSFRRDSTGSRLGWPGPETCYLSGSAEYGRLAPANPQTGTGERRVWQMNCTLHVAWDERLTDYHFGPSHPLAPVRVELTMRLAHEFGLWAQPGVTVAAPPPATEVNLELVHDARYITAVRTVGRWTEELGAGGLEATQFRYARRFGLGTADQPAFAGMHEASALVAGATLAAARAVWSGPARHGASMAGGMHHAMAACASGFGVYNDVAVAIAWLLQHGAERIAYVDIDAHHGDGVQAAFYDDPRVLTISLHQHPATLFPFTGLPAETGGPGAEGSAVNVALPARTGNA